MPEVKYPSKERVERDGVLIHAEGARATLVVRRRRHKSGGEVSERILNTARARPPSPAGSIRPAAFARHQVRIEPRGAVDATTGIPPVVTAETEAVWEGFQRGVLLAERCRACGAESFPPRGMCRRCGARDAELVEVAGPGHVYSLTVNHQRWLPDLEVPFAIVLVEFADHPGVRVAGRLRGCAPEEAHIEMAVDVGFEPGPGGFAIPSFVARDGAA